MSKNNNIITINGRDYDAKTGIALDGGKPASKPKLKTPAKTTKVIAKKPSTAAKTTIKQSANSKKAHKQAANLKPHAPKSATTLMRKAVKKPSSKSKSSLKVAGEIRVEPKVSHGAINTKLLSYAKRIHKSPLIKHFGDMAASDLAVQQTNTKTPATTKKPTYKPTNVKKKPKTTAELLDYAIAQSTSHEQAPPAKRSRNPLKRKS